MRLAKRFAVLVLSVLTASSLAAPSVVKLVKNGDAYSLLVDGNPYFIKGAGGSASMPLLVKLGGNSTRTWDAEKIDKQLDEAQKLGMKVTVGIWLGHVRDGFKYDDPKMVADQFKRAQAAILRYKNHPAVLMWGIGNEMESFGDGGDPNVWNAVEAIAKEAKRIDPNHPTMVVTADIGGKRIEALNKYCPDIDILGVNSYGGAASVFTRYKGLGGTKPYVLTEFGPLGPWEVGKTAWGAPIEATSTQKGATYREAYQKAVLDAKGLCLGAYAFVWGDKMESTATWFGMLLPTGERLEATDVMSEFWTGKPPANRVPKIDILEPVGPVDVEPNYRVRVHLKATDPEGNPLRVRWVLRGDTPRIGSEGKAEPNLPEYPDALLSGDLGSATLKLPSIPGGYRLFAYIYDGKGGAAVGNVPFHVHEASTK